MYLARHHVQVATAIDAAIRNPSAWSAMTSPEQMRSIGLTRPLLQVLISTFLS